MQYMEVMRVGSQLRHFTFFDDFPEPDDQPMAQQQQQQEEEEEEVSCWAEHTKALEQNTGKTNQAYIPKCTGDGKFEKVQCYEVSILHSCHECSELENAKSTSLS